MKFNKWTLGLAALGAVSLASVAQAEEQMNAVQTALSSTTLSGYIDTSMEWNPGTGNENLPGYKFGGSDKADGFNLNVVQLTISKALDETEWAAGYRADLWFGPDANTLNTASSLSFGASGQDFAIRQAYVALRTPVGNGIDWKIGVFDTILGYETLESGNNPNMTRSYGFTLEPTTQTGLLATYRFTDSIAVSGGIADTVGPSINARANPPQGPQAESFKAYTGSVALTAPSDWGWIAGSSLYGGVLCGWDPTSFGTRDNYYVGATVNTPVTGLKAGVSFDYAHMWGAATTSSVISPGVFPAAIENQYAWALYLSYQATEKMSLHGRAETIREQGDVAGSDNEAYALTGTIQYNLWENVISRAEIRWDHGDQPSYGSAGNLQKNAVMVAANFIYKF